MRGQSPLMRMATGLRRQQQQLARPLDFCRQCRAIQISASPTTENPQVGGDAFGSLSSAPRDPADARFEVLGSPYSLLSVTLSASQNLYTRRGTLVGVAGSAENAQSTLSLLSPFTRALTGVPFLYQRISSTTPITALISTKSHTTTFTTLHLDGTTDWMVSQRNALLAWTGHTLSPTPRIRTSLGASHWGSTHLTGRGLVALSSPGNVYQLTLAEGEEFVAHPSNVVAYSVSRNAPAPFRFKSSVLRLRLQVPSLSAWFPTVEFFRAMRTTETYKNLAAFLYGLRTSLRRSIWGDRLFLRFQGPGALLLSSRGVRVAEALSREEVNEIADTPAGTAAEAVRRAAAAKEEEGSKEAPRPAPPVVMRTATVSKDGKVTFEDSKELKDRM